MMYLIGYATTEGQTRQIARHVARRIARAGHGAEMLPLGEAEEIALDAFDGIVLAASLHAGHYQRALSDFAEAHATALAAKQTLFLSVSLAAAGHDADDWRGLDVILEDLQTATGWTPGQVAQIAGAYRPSRYDIVRRFIMRRIIAQKDPEADPAVDRDYTDWPALEALVDAWLAG